MKRVLGKWACIAVVFALLIPVLASPVLAAPPNRTTAIVINGQDLHFMQRPIGTGDNALVPFRTVFRALGAEVKWDGANRTAVAQWQGSIIRFPMNAKWAELDGHRHQLPVASRIVKGSSFVPVSFLADALGLEVSWDNSKLIISLPVQRDLPLEHSIIIDREGGRLGLTVKNPNRHAVELVFNSSKTHDFIIRSGGGKIWRASDGQAYLMMIHLVTLTAGESRTYWTDMPQLASGAYIVEGFFGSGERAVARAQLNIAKNEAPSVFQYTVVIDRENNRVGLTVKNTSAQRTTVTLPSTKTHDFTIKLGNQQVWRASDGQMYAPVVTTVNFSAGQSRTYWTTLPQLAAGDYVVEGYFADLERPLARAALNIAAPQTALKYWLLYDADEQRLGLMVFNDSANVVNLSFPTSKTHDFILRQNGQKVWQASDGQFYSQVITQERIAARSYRVYWTDLPVLAGGSYQAEAYFSGNGPERRVASSTITIAQADPLQYLLSFEQRSLLGNGPRLALEVRNLGDKDLMLPAQYGYRVIVKTPTGTTMPGVGFSQSVGTVLVGAIRYHYSYLHNLPSGSYVAEVQSNVTGSYRTVARQSFVMP